MGVIRKKIRNSTKSTKVKTTLKSAGKCKNRKAINKEQLNLKGKGKVVKRVVVKKSNRVKLRAEKVRYTLDAIKSALEEIKSGTSYRAVSVKYNIPASTLHRKLKNPEKEKTSHGPAPILTESIEKDIVTWIIQRAAAGQPVTKSLLLDNVQSFLNKLNIKNTPFTNNRPSRHWYEAFRKRHPEITLRTAQYLSRARAEATEEVLRDWYKDTQEYLEIKNLLSINRSRIFNCDETNIQLCPKSHKVLTITGVSNVYKHTDTSEKEILTALMMYSAAGVRAPPLILYKYAEKVPKKIVKESVKDWGIGITESGWMTSEAFYEYFTNVFYPWLTAERTEFPIIVYLDGHSSHVTVPLVQFCREKLIEIICLYPNSTHITQPLDISFFHPFKECWRKTVAEWKAENDEARVTKELFPKLLKMTLDAFEGEEKSVQNGFKKAGLYPFNPDNVDFKHLHVKNVSKRKSTEEASALIEEPNIHLLSFEKNLPPELFKSFKECEEHNCWTGLIDHKGLFDYWIQIKKQLTGKNKKPFIKSSEILTGHKIIVINKSQQESTIIFESNASTEEIKDSPNENLTGENSSSWLDPIIIDPSAITALDESNVVNNTEQRFMLTENILEMIPIDVPVLDVTVATLQNETDNNSIKRDENGISSHSSDFVSTEKTECKNLNSSSSDIVCDLSSEQHKSINETQSQIITNNSINYDNNNNDKENDSTTINKKETSNTSSNFAQIFKYPIECLPKNRREEMKNKKSISVTTSDDWLNMTLEQEEEEKKKKERAEEKKMLQNKKKELADAKKKLETQMREIQVQIKNNTPQKIKK